MISDLWIVCPTPEIKEQVAAKLRQLGIVSHGYIRGDNGVLRVRDGASFLGFYSNKRITELVHRVRQRPHCTASQFLADPERWLAENRTNLM